ncbi:MAG: glycerol-3-phosphate acyltransferase [Anaerolineales bacterium]|nr:MAG: glycerol-3-phosphate acyltransferase [Anaerolineales bacterium]
MLEVGLPNIIICVVAYLVGSIPFGIIITRLLRGTDVRLHGSGHAGATNTMRVAGWLPGIAVMVLDLGKGAFIAWLALRFGSKASVAWFATALVIVGHCWPVFAGFRGGMGMATAGGAFLVFWPLGFVLGIGLAAAMQLWVRHSARANIATGILLAPMWFLFGASVLQVGAAIASGLVVILRSISDWNRVYSELWFDRKDGAEK